MGTQASTGTPVAARRSCSPVEHMTEQDFQMLGCSAVINGNKCRNKAHVNGVCTECGTPHVWKKLPSKQGT